MLINHIRNADPDTHFTPQTFDPLIGREVPVRVDGDQIGTGRIITVTVTPDGGSAKFLLELPVDTEELWAHILPKGYTELSIDLPGT